MPERRKPAGGQPSDDVNARTLKRLREGIDAGQLAKRGQHKHGRLRVLMVDVEGDALALQTAIDQISAVLNNAIM